MSEVLIRLGSTKWSGAFTEFFYMRKYKRKPGFRVEIKKRFYSGRWFIEAKGAVLTIEEAVEWLKNNTWWAINEEEILKELKEKFGEVGA